MSALSINGITVPTLANSSRDIINLGGVERAESGKVRSYERGTYYEHRFTTPPMKMADSEAYKALIRGDGHTLSFESTFTATSFMWTSRGIPPTVGPATRDTTTARHGSASMSLPLNEAASWGIQDGCVCWFGWVKEGAGPWRHVVRIGGFSGPVYIDGVYAGTTYDFGYASGLGVVLGDVDAIGVATHFDDVVLLPYAPPESWVPLIYAYHSDNAWSPLKYVYASGARFSGTKKVMGVIESVTDVEFGDVDGFHQGEQVTFLLKESP